MRFFFAVACLSDISHENISNSVDENEISFGRKTDISDFINNIEEKHTI
jgi:hypothetical protein